MTLDITMKPVKPVTELFESAELKTRSNAKMVFKSASKEEVQISPLGTSPTGGYFWNVEALRELSDACQRIAHILDKQNEQNN